MVSKKNVDKTVNQTSEMQVGNIFDFGKKSLLKEILATEKKISKLDKKINSNDETLNELKKQRVELNTMLASLNSLKSNTGIN